MSKILVVGDLHIGANENNPPFVNYQKKTIEWIKDTYNKYSCDEVIFLGDIFDTANKNKLSCDTLSIFTNNLLYWDVPINMIVGNHDTPNKNTLDKTPLKTFSYHSCIVDTPRKLKLSNTDDITIIPWICADNISECIATINNSNSKYCFGHFELNGFEMIRGFNCDKSEFDRNILDRFKTVYSGHFHLHQRKGNINYVGSCCELNWGDAGEDKFIFVLDMETGEELSIQNPYKFYTKVVVNNKETLNNYYSQIYSEDINVKIILECERTKDIDKILDSMVEYSNIEVVNKFEAITLKNDIKVYRYLQ
jgi:DNA repair exonuclease SbcCD nuclease subunit